MKINKIKNILMTLSCIFCMFCVFFNGCGLQMLTVSASTAVPIPDKGSEDPNDVTNTDEAEGPNIKIHESTVAVRGYLGPVNDPTVVYISISVPLDTFFQIATNISDGGNATFISPTYKIINNGPNPVRVTSLGVFNQDGGPVEGHTVDTPIELDPAATSADQKTGRLKIGLLTLANWIDKNRVPMTAETVTSSPYVLDSVTNPMPTEELGYIDGTASTPAEASRTATYEYEPLHDLLATNEYAGVQKETTFSVKLSFKSVVLLATGDPIE